VRPAHSGAKIGHEPVDHLPRACNKAPEISQKGHVMFRKVAIALVAASVLTVPVLAQDAAPGAGKAAQTTTAPATTVKTVKAGKVTTKHRMVTRHHRHHHHVAMVGHAKQGKHVGHMKYAHHTKLVHHMKHGETAAKPVSGKLVTARHVAAKPTVRPGAN